jgi:hypothetical protein
MFPPNPQSPPRPSKTLVALSILVIAACMFLVSMGIASMTVTWDPCAMFGGLMIIPVPALLVLQQYSGTFKRHYKAAQFAGALCLVLSGFPLMGVVGGTLESIGDGKSLPIDFILALIACAAPFVVAGYLNLRWSRHLEASDYRPTDERFRMSMRELLVATAVICAMLAMTMTFVRNQPKQFGVNVTAEESGLSLPDNATRVSYARGTLLFEFDTDETSFRKWVEAGVGEIESGPVNGPLWPIENEIEVVRFISFAPGVAGPERVALTDGLFYRASSGDQWIDVAFDRKTNRAYFYANYN